MEYHRKNLIDKAKNNDEYAIAEIIKRYEHQYELAKEYRYIRKANKYAELLEDMERYRDMVIMSIDSTANELAYNLNVMRNGPVYSNQLISAILNRLVNPCNYGSNAIKFKKMFLEKYPKYKDLIQSIHCSVWRNKHYWQF